MRTPKSQTRPNRTERSLRSWIVVFCVLFFGVALWIYLGTSQQSFSAQRDLGRESAEHHDSIMKSDDETRRPVDRKLLHRKTQDILKKVSPTPASSAHKTERPVDVSHLKGAEVWEDPKLEHCKRLFDPARLKQTTPVHVSAKRNEDGELIYQVKAIGSCVPKDLFDSVDIDIPACEKGVQPRKLEEMSDCESARMAHLQEIPKNLSFDANGTVEYYYFHNPSKEVEKSPDDMELPEVEDELSELSPDEIQHTSHTLKRSSRRPPDERLPLVVCADYEVFSRTLYENLLSVIDDFPAIELYWVVRPLKNDVTSQNLAIAGAAAASLGVQWEANNLLFDMTGAESLEDIASAMSGLDVDRDKLIAAMHSREIKKKVSNGIRWCEDQGMSNTPTMKFEGQIKVGSRSSEQLRSFLAQGKKVGK